jgi:hexosaminidase
MFKPVLTLLFAFSLFPLPADAAHKPLLPRPREVRYGSGNLPLRGLSVRIASAAGEEERFTASELAAFLSATAGTPVRVAAAAAGPGITLRRTGSADPLALPGEPAGPGSRESYSLKVGAAGAELSAPSSAGLYYAAQTLRQLVEGKGAAAVLPEVEIRDWPSLAYRGVMIDTSHGPLPTEKEIQRQLDFMARWKINQYYLYSEAGIELKGFPNLNPDARYSQEEIRRIVAYARQRHIDVVPCMELYGHLHDLFRIERFADLGIVRHGSEFNPENPKVAELLADWIKQLTDLFPSRFFHVGFDETWETAAVAGLDKAGAARFYLQHFRRISDMVRGRGRTVMVWSDMFSKYPEYIDQLPPGTIVVPWGYDREVYEPYWKPFTEGATPPRMIASGVSIWTQIAPNFDRSFDNIDASLAVGRARHATGLINTVWTDSVAVLMRPVLPGLAYGGAASWQSDPVNRKIFFSEYAALMYPGPAAEEVAEGLAALDRSENEMARVTNRGPKEWEETSPSFWDNPLAARHLSNAVANREGFGRVRLRAEEAEEHLARALQLGGDPAILSDFLLEARMLDYAGMKNVYAAEMADFWKTLGDRPARDKLEHFVSGEVATRNHSRIADLMDLSGDLREAWRAAWLASYTPYRLGAILGKWDAEFQYWWRLKRRLDDFVDGFKDGDSLPPLESFNPGY